MNNLKFDDILQFLRDGREAAVGSLAVNAWSDAYLAALVLKEKSDQWPDAFTPNEAQSEGQPE